MRRSMILFPWVLSGFISLSGFVARGEPQTELAARLQVDPQLYMVVDLSEGSAASQYPVSYLSAVPAGGWSEEYRTTKMVLRRMPAGTYSMGSPVNELDRQDDETQHEVTLTSSFYIGVYEVTQKQWERVMGTWPSYFNNTLVRDARPVEQVSYNMIRGASLGAGWPATNAVDLTSFMGKLRAKTGLAQVDLPTEAQWEYSCRAGTLTSLNSGFDMTNVLSDAHMSEVGRYYYNGGSAYSQSCSTNAGSARVGSYLPNNWGLYDAHGNTYEWCLDWFGAYSGPTNDPKGVTFGTKRLLRGGSWDFAAVSCRSGDRNYYSPDTVRSGFGFRTVSAMPPGFSLTVVNGSGGGTYAEGCVVEVEASEPAAGKRFVRWDVDPSDVNLGTGFSSVQAVTSVAMPNRNVTLTPVFEAVTCTVTFDPAGGLVDPTSKVVTCEERHGDLPEPVRNGYSFSGWWTALGGTGWLITSATVVTNLTDYTLYADWVANDYVVSFDAGGGTVDPTTKTVTFNAAYGDLPVPERAGYTFSGWQASTNDVSVDVDAATVVSIAADHVLSAKWTANSYTVSFDPRGGAVSPSSKVVTFGATYGALPVPERAGYSFSGWIASANGSNIDVGASTVVSIAADHALAAKWTARRYTVSFDPRGGSVLATSKEVVFDAAYGDLPVPVRSGYTFAGWLAANTGVSVVVDAATVVSIAADHTLTAEWTASSFTVYFDPCGGTVDPSSKVVTYNAVYGELPVPERAGYIFSGWQASTNGVSVDVVAATVVSTAADHTLAAKWTASSYTVSFDPRGGSVDPSSKVVTYDAEYGALPDPIMTSPVRVGYAFGGWYASPVCSGPPVASGTIVKTAMDHTLYAKWVADSYLCTPDTDSALETTGKYIGYFYGQEPFADLEAPAIRGTFDMTLSSTNGKFTAKAKLQSGQITFTSKAWTSLDADGNRRATLTARGGETLDLFVRQNRVWGTLSGGTLASEPLELDGARNRFVDRKDSGAQTILENLKGYYTVSMPVLAADATGAAQAVPSGCGYLTLTVGNNGGVKIAGKLADGSGFSQSATLVLFEGCGSEVCVPLFVPLYSRKGWAGGLLWFTSGGKGAVVTDRDLGWYVRWEKPAEKVDGVSALLDASGGYYSGVEALAEHYLLTAETNTVPYYYSGGAAELQTAALPNGIGVTRNGTRLTITRGTAPELVGDAYEYSAENNAMASFTGAVRTGLFSGSFYLYYDYTVNSRLQHKKVKVAYSGVFTPVRGQAFADEPAGQGFYLVPDNNPLWRSSPFKHSYRMTLEAIP